MKQEVRNYINSLNRRDFTNNNQRVLYTLVRALDSGTDGWVSTKSLRVSSAGSRVRSLRTDEFGGFKIDCDKASRLERRGEGFYYRLGDRNLTLAKLRRLFRQ